MIQASWANISKNTMDLKVLSEKFAEYFTNKNVAGLGALMDEHFSLFDPGLQFHGKKQALKFLKEGLDRAQAVSYKIIHLYREEDTTILEFKINMDAKEFNGVDFIRWENDKMIELRCYYNPPQT